MDAEETTASVSSDYPEESSNASATTIATLATL
jgi:hypothetical protein